MRIKKILNKKVSQKENENIDLNLLNPIIEKYKNKKGNLIPVLQKTQEIYKYIPDIVFYKISKDLGHSLSELYGVATFYSQFRLNPVGKHIIKVCHGTACHVQDAVEITDAIKDFLKINDGETTENGLFTLESVACLGCCSLAPVMMIGEETYGKLNQKKTVKFLKNIIKKNN